MDNTTRQPSKFRAKNWVEMNDDSRGTHNTDSQTKFKTLIISQIYVVMVMHTYFLMEP